MESITRIRVQKTAEIVANQVRNSIARGELSPGDSLPGEAELISRFEVSRPTIREAIRILESEGMISVFRGARGGAKVNEHTSALVSRAVGVTLQARRAPLSDIYDLRMIIEPAAAGAAARFRPKEAAAALREQMHFEVSVIAEKTKIARALADFHRILLEQSGNAAFVLIGDALQEVVVKHHSLIHRAAAISESEEVSMKRRRAGLRSHEKLVSLIEERDAAGAEAHWRRHMMKAREFWFDGIPDKATVNILD